MSWMKNLFGPGNADDDDPATEEFATLSSFTLLPGQLKLKVGVVSVRGNYREHNEDNFYVPGRRPVRHDSGSESQSEHARDDARALQPVHRGRRDGGPAGRRASQPDGGRADPPGDRPAPATRMRQEPSRIKEAIRDAVAEVNQEILGSSGAVTEFSNMGTTVVLAQFRSDRVFVAGIGDSRAYRLRDGRLEQLTKDHSLADALLDAGTITAEELPNHKFKNVLYLYLGSKDARGGPEDVRVLDVRPGDRLLMASDGLTGVVADKDLCQSPGHGRRSAARRRDPQGHGPLQRFQGQCDLPDHSCRRGARLSRRRRLTAPHG